MAFEVSFCILRALFSGANFDCVQFVERASAVMIIQRIFTRRPEIELASRHLVPPDPTSGVATQDHMNPSSYLRIEGEEGGVDRTRCSIKKNVCNPVKAWNDTPVRISTFLAEQGFAPELLNFIAIASSGVDMLRPEGRWVGVTAIELDDEVDEIVVSEDVGGDDDFELEATPNIENEEHIHSMKSQEHYVKTKSNENLARPSCRRPPTCQATRRRLRDASPSPGSPATSRSSWLSRTLLVTRR